MKTRNSSRAIGKLVSLSQVICLCFVTALAVHAQSATGKVEGMVIIRDSQGNLSSLSKVKVVLNGAVTKEMETDDQGQYAFLDVPAGNYSIRASFPGFEATQTIQVQAGEALAIDLELQPMAVKSSITVTATAEEGKQVAPTGTVTEKTLRDAPNADQRVESALPLIPGVVRGPDGRVNLKGGRITQSGALVNSANVTDPATGSPAMNLPIDVVSSVQVISNPYDPQYGKLAGAVSTVETKTGNYSNLHVSFQNFFPRFRNRDGAIRGIGATTPRLTFTGPIVKDRIAFTQSLEYRFVRTPVNSLPPLERDSKLESFDSFTQFDVIINPKQTATVSFAIYPQKLDYYGLNTFTPQPSTPDFHQRGNQVYLQHRYLVSDQSALISQFSYKTFDADVTAQSDDPYHLLPDTTEGGFFSRQARRSSRVELQEVYQFAPRQFLGAHQFKIGLNYAHSSYTGRQTFLPVVIADASGSAIAQITFTQPTRFDVGQNETAWYASDQWFVASRLTLTLGLRVDNDTVTDSTHVSPRASFAYSLTRDSKTLLKGGAGIFYDRVPLMIPGFEDLPERTVTSFDPAGQASSSIHYRNQIVGKLQNPRSTSWNLELDRQVLQRLWLRVAYEQRNTSKDFVVSPLGAGATAVLGVSNRGASFYKEFQVTGRYQVGKHFLNASYVRSKAFGDLNDFNQFFGTLAQPVIQVNARGRQPFDAPNRFLVWGDIAGPWKITLIPVYDLHTGFPYSTQNEFRDYVGPRNTRRFPRFSSFDLQMTRRVSLHLFHARIGFAVYNVFNHFNPRDVQSNLDSAQYGGFFNNAWREYRGKFILEF